MIINHQHYLLTLHTVPPSHQGVSSHIKFKAAGELQPSGKREVYFEANGVPRVVEVTDTRHAESVGKRAVREKVCYSKILQFLYILIT